MSMLYVIASTMQEAEAYCRWAGVSPRDRTVKIITPSNGARALLGASIGPGRVKDIVRPEVLSDGDLDRMIEVRTQLGIARARGGSA